MKYLSHYTQQAQTDLFNKTGAFFAFSAKQFDEAKKEGVQYVDVGSGLICPVGKGKEILEGLNRITAEGIKADIEENGISAIIQRELGNHEAQLTGDLTDTIDALADYKIPLSEIKAGYITFYDTCVKNDWF